jgi:hypothetical protein
MCPGSGNKIGRRFVNKMSQVKGICYMCLFLSYRINEIVSL